MFISHKDKGQGHTRKDLDKESGFLPWWSHSCQGQWRRHPVFQVPQICQNNSNEAMFTNNGPQGWVCLHPY